MARLQTDGMVKSQPVAAFGTVLRQAFVPASTLRRRLRPADEAGPERVNHLLGQRPRF